MVIEETVEGFVEGFDGAASRPFTSKRSPEIVSGIVGRECLFKMRNAICEQAEVAYRNLHFLLKEKFPVKTACRRWYLPCWQI